MLPNGSLTSAVKWDAAPRQPQQQANANRRALNRSRIEYVQIGQRVGMRVVLASLPLRQRSIREGRSPHDHLCPKPSQTLQLQSWVFESILCKQERAAVKRRLQRQSVAELEDLSAFFELPSMPQSHIKAVWLASKLCSYGASDTTD